MRKKESLVDEIEQATTDEPFPQVADSQASASQPHEDPRDPMVVQSFLPRYGGEGCNNHLMAEIVINGEIFDAYTEMTKAIPERVEPALVLSWYLHELAQGFGVFESLDNEDDPVERVHCPEWAYPLLGHCLAADEYPIQADRLRNVLYQACLAVADNRSERQFINRRKAPTETGVLMMAQVYWNLESDETRTRLPIPAGEPFTGAGGEAQAAGLKVPNDNADYALMPWTKRIGRGAMWPGGKTSGGGFRTQGARLLVLVARHIIAQSRFPLPELDALELTVITEGNKVSAAITWADTPHEGDREPVAAGGSADNEQSPRVANGAAPSAPVRVGTFAEIGGNYQHRSFDSQIEAFWADGGDRRIWLRGAPGQGKTFSARRVMQDAITRHSTDPVQLLIWVDTADARTVVEALAEAVDQLPSIMPNLLAELARLRQKHLEPQTFVSGDHEQNRAHLPSDSRSGEDASPSMSAKARALLEVLRLSSWRWLVVLDNANAEQLIEQRLIPTGMNPNGRVLITTTSPAHRMRSEGRVVEAELFTQDEALEYLEKQLPRTTETSRSALASAVGHHPLALSIASSTIEAHAMEIEEWLEEFASSDSMDHAADEGDRGGYPHGLSATWRLALAKASQGLPEGLVERAALVAAIQDPDGHPTWLWEHEEVTEWIASGSRLERRHGRPVVLQRLIEYGVLELRGDTWRQGRIAIHQLAARAIRELVPQTDLVQIAKILVKEWHLRLAAEDIIHGATGLFGNLQAIAASTEFAQERNRTLFALLEFAGSGRRAIQVAEYRSQEGRWLGTLEERTAVLQFLTSVQEHVSPFAAEGLGLFASEVARAADSRHRIKEAQRFLTKALEFLESAAQGYGDAADVPQRSRALSSKVSVLERLGRTEEARALRKQLVDEGISFLGTDPGVGERFHQVDQIVDTLRELNELQRADEILRENYHLLMKITEFEVDESCSKEESIFLAVMRIWELSSFREHQLALGRAHDADATVSLQYELAKRWLPSSQARKSELEYIQVLLQQAKWDDAAHLLEQLVRAEWRIDDRDLADDTLRLASVYANRGQKVEATQAISDAASGYEKLVFAVENLQHFEWEQAGVWQLSFSTLAWIAGEEVSRRGEESLPFLERAVEFTKQASENHPGVLEKKLASLFSSLGYALYKAGRRAEASEAWASEVAILKTLSQLSPGDRELKDSLISSMLFLGMNFQSLGNHEASYEYLMKVVDAICDLGGPTAKEIRIQKMTLDALQFFGMACSELGRTEKFIEAWDRIAELDLFQVSELTDEIREDLVGVLLVQAHMRYGLGHFDAAAELATQLLELADSSTGTNLVTLSTRGNLHWMIGCPEGVRGDTGNQNMHLLKAQEMFTQVVIEEPHDLEIQFRLAMVLLTLAQGHHEAGESDEMILCLEKANRITSMLVLSEEQESRLRLLPLWQELESGWLAVGRRDEAYEAAHQAQLLLDQGPSAGPDGNPY